MNRQECNKLCDFARHYEGWAGSFGRFGVFGTSEWEGGARRMKLTERSLETFELNLRNEIFTELLNDFNMQLIVS